MKSFLIFGLIVCYVQAESKIIQTRVAPEVSREYDVTEKMSDLIINVQQIHKDYKKYKQQVFEDVRKTYDEFEKVLIQEHGKQILAFSNLKNNYNDNSLNINKTLINNCHKTFKDQLPTFKTSEDGYKLCLSKAEITHYQLPINDCEFILSSMSEKLQTSINEFVKECDYWKESNVLNLKKNECFDLKKPGYDTMITGLGKTSIKLSNFLYECSKTLKSESEKCASIETLKLNEKIMKIENNLDSCINY